MVATRSMMGNNRQIEEGSSPDLMALMLEMKKELEDMKQKNTKEIKRLRAENQMMKEKLVCGYTLSAEDNVGS